VGVEVDSGVVTLTGTVNSYAKRVAAQEAAHRVGGVLDVANEIHVNVPGMLERTDTEIALAVRRALDWDVQVPDRSILSTVAGGVVTLEGSVDFPHEREDAERAVHNLTGVRGVINKLVVSPPFVEADEVRREIEGAPERRAEREAKRIRVTVRDGTVTLSGPVHSWREKQAVLGAARLLLGSVADEVVCRAEQSVFLITARAVTGDRSVPSSVWPKQVTS
jgi:osmotically-inducible protein OsmY